MWIDVQSHILGLITDIMSMPSEPGHMVGTMNAAECIGDILARENYLLLKYNKTYKNGKGLNPYYSSASSAAIVVTVITIIIVIFVARRQKIE